MHHRRRLAAAIPFLLIPLIGRAYDVGSPQAGSPGTDAYFTSVAGVASVAQGNPAEPASSVGSVSGSTSGNAVTVTGAEDAEAQAADYFEVSWRPLSGGATTSCVQNLTGSSTVASLCAAISSGCGGVACAMKPPPTCSSCPAEDMQITTPFLTTVQTFGFYHNAIAAKLSTLETNTVTDAEADVVNAFTLTLGTTTVTAAGDDFASVTDLAGLASVLDAKGAGVFDVSVVSDHLLFQAAVPSYAEFGGLSLGTNHVATSAVTTVSGVTDAHAALVNQVSMTVRGTPIVDDSLDFSSIDDASELASALETLAGIAAVTYDANADTLTITADPGAGSITGVELVIVPSLTIASQAPTYMEDGYAEPLTGVEIVLPEDATIASVTVRIAQGLANGEDALAVTSAGSISASYDASTGTLSLSGTGTVSEFEATLASLRYENSSQAPTTTDRRIEAVVVEGTGLTSEALVRVIQVQAINDAPIVSLASATPAVTVGLASSVLDGAAVFDADDATLTSAEVSIAAGFEVGDMLAAAPHGSIVSSWDANSHVLTLSGVADIAEYQDLLRTVTLLSTRERPGTYARSISVLVRDAHDESAAEAITVNVTHACVDGTIASGDACVAVPVDAGVGESDAGVAMPDGGPESDSDAGDGPGRIHGGGCSIDSTRSAGPEAWLALAVVTIVLQARRRRRND